MSSKFRIHECKGLRIHAKVEYYDPYSKSFEEEVIYLDFEFLKPEEDFQIEEIFEAIDEKVFQILKNSQKIREKSDIGLTFYSAYNDYLEKWEYIEDWTDNRESGRV